MLVDQLKKYKIYLASTSPRRHQLIREMGIDFSPLLLNVEENYPEQLQPVEVAEYLSRLKLSPVKMDEYPENTIFIACDTIVVLDDEIIGKPEDHQDAISTLKKLSGNDHVVISGLTVATPKKQLTASKQTRVRFKKLTEEEIVYYISNYLPLDKAGAYGVQEWIGYIGIEYIEGSFYNIMGLPTKLLWDMLQEITT